MTKTVIIGSNHAGIAAGNALLDNFKEQEVVMIEKNSNFSYLSCGTALWVGRQIEEVDGLFYTNRDDFEAKGAKVYLETAVDHVDFENKTVHCVTITGEEIVETYDKLVLATGSVPISPNIPGKDLKNITFMKKFQEGQFIDGLLAQEEFQNIAVVGAGYIGVEMAEAAKRRGKNVMLFDLADRTLSSYYDRAFTNKMDRNSSILRVSGHIRKQQHKQYEKADNHPHWNNDSCRYNFACILFLLFHTSPLHCIKKIPSIILYSHIGRWPLLICSNTFPKNNPRAISRTLQQRYPEGY